MSGFAPPAGSCDWADVGGGADSLGLKSEPDERERIFTGFSGPVRHEAVSSEGRNRGRLTSDHTAAEGRAERRSGARLRSGISMPPFLLLAPVNISPLHP